MTKRAGSGSAMHALLDLDLGEESSSDSDFCIEDHNDDDGSDFTEDDDDDDDDKSDDNGEDSDDSDNGDDENAIDKGSATNGAQGDDFAQFKNHLNAGSSPSAAAIAAMPVSLANGVGGGGGCGLSAKRLAQQAKAREALERANAKLLATPICCACLGDRSDDANEIVECDSCGISVHEGCYGIADSASVSSTVSSCSTEPWFCEACKANIAEPVCELCPNRGGIFKETDVGKWVHLVCALYVPGVAFGEVDLLSSVTLFEMPYSKWGAKMCSLCDDVRFARTGVCIGCDAGMCRTYFHVTCAQAAGLLSEAHLEEADHADPFYAHCKVHSDKALIKKRKRNYNGLRLKMAHRKGATSNTTDTEAEHKNDAAAAPVTLSDAQLRIERKLKKHRIKYVQLKGGKQKPWVPTQKMPRLLSTSASACRQLMHKADLMGVDTVAVEFQETQMAALADVRKKWHIPPAFSVEFIGYYLDRTTRLLEIKASLQRQSDRNRQLVDMQQQLRTEYDDLVRVQTAQTERNAELKEKIERLHATIIMFVPGKSLPDIELIGRPPRVVLEKLQPITPKEECASNATTAPIPSIIRPTHGQTSAAFSETASAAAATVQHLPPPPPARPMSVPTAAALKMGVGFPLTNLPGTHEDPNRILSTQCQIRSASQTNSRPVTANSSTSVSTLTKLMHECGICAKRTDQHMLAKCDTCTLYYHLGCLNPPLQRHPKKSKLYGWQCSECVDSDAPVNLPVGPRKSRTKYAKDGTIVPVDPQPLDDTTQTTSDTSVQSTTPNSSFSNQPMRVKAKGPGRPRNADKRPAATDANTSSGGCVGAGNVSSADETGASTATKRKKVKKSVTVASDTDAGGVAGSEPITNVKDETTLKFIVTSSSSSLLDQKQSQQPPSTTTTTTASTGSLEYCPSVADARSIKMGPETTDDKPQQATPSKHEFANETTNGSAAHLPPTPSAVKPKSAKKLKKEKDAAAPSTTAGPAGAVEMTKPAFYIDQNGVLTDLQQSQIITPNGLATNKLHQLHQSTGKEVNNIITVAADAPLISDDSKTTDAAATADSTNTIHNTVAMTDAELLLLHKQNRKRRKELKHRQRHGGGGISGNGASGDDVMDGSARAGNGDANGERSPNKEHKKKRKKKNHDMENPAMQYNNDGIPRIKIKFKALSLPGEPSTESHCYYVSADMVRPADDDIASNDSPLPSRSFRESTTPQKDGRHLQQEEPQNDIVDVNDNGQMASSTSTNGSKTAATAAINTSETNKSSKVSKNTTPTASLNAASEPKPVGRPPKPMPHRRLSVFNPKKFSAAVAQALKKNGPSAAMVAGPKSAKAKLAKLAAAAAAAMSASAASESLNLTGHETNNATTAAATIAAAIKTANIKCDVCLTAGTTLDVVRCDECKKNYHFRCLEPPLKKTPKRRGYSWHCADCDPTDVEST